MSRNVYNRLPRAGETLALCDECKTPYPPELISTLTGSNNLRRDVCGICALEEVNRIHGERRQSFRTGTQAEQMRLDAIAWRKANS